MGQKNFDDNVQQFKLNRDYNGLHKLIRGCHEYQKHQIAKALEEIGDEKAMETLAKIITDRPTEFGRIASTSLSKMTNKANVVKYALLAYENGIKKGMAKSSVDGVNLKESVKLVINSLGEKAVGPLLDILTTEGYTESILISELLPLCVTNNSIELLKDKLLYPDWWIREIITKNLLLLKWEPSTTEEKVAVLISRLNWKELEKLGEQAVKYITESMDINDRRLIKRKPNIINVIGKIGSPLATESLIISLNNKSYPKQTINALGFLGDPKAVSPIMNYVKGLSSFSILLHSSMYIKSLTNIGNPAIKELNPFLKDSNKNVRKIAQKTLKRLKYQTY